MEPISSCDIQEVYALFGDEESKFIFSNRLLYSLTHDSRYIRNIICNNEFGKKTYERLKRKNKSIAIFGAGSVGKRLVRIFDDVDIDCLIDNNANETEYGGIPIISFEKYQAVYHDGTIIISAKYCWNEIYNQLICNGIEKDNIINLGLEYLKLSHLQYFDLPQLQDQSSQKEVFVDGGCYDGSTSLEFTKWCNKPKFIYAWEPDEKNTFICKNKLSKLNVDYSIIEKAVWNKRDELRFINDKGQGSSVSLKGTTIIEADCIDNLCEIPATYIKLDVEGAEFEALIGAQNMIKKFKPKLAVCVYHKDEDIWKIPVLIHKLNSTYSLYLRHYSYGDVETVLYAV